MFETQKKSGGVARGCLHSLRLILAVIPALIVGFLVFRGVDALVNWTNHQIDLNARAGVYIQTATAITEPLTPTTTSTPAAGAYVPASNNGSLVMVGGLQQEPSRTPFPTNTPQPTDTPQATPEVQATPTLMETTPRPLPTVFLPQAAGPDIVAVTAVPTPFPLIQRDYDLMNILLIGDDGEVDPTDSLIRTDTMIVVSINRDTGTVNMISLPRDLFVYIPGWTVQRLNLAYQHGESVGWTDGGFGLMRQTLLYNFGINVHYYASVDFDGFEQIVDTLGGVDIAVDCPIQDYVFKGRDAFDQPIYELETLDVGVHHLDGETALWYARSRRNSDDFDRGRRQQQVLRAIWREANAQGLIGRAVDLWPQMEQIVETDLTLADIIGLIPVGLNLDSTSIESLNFIRWYHTTPWTTPDGSNVQLPVPDTLLELMTDFYTPPTDNQLVRERASIEVVNGTTNPGWDQVAAERLAWDGFLAYAGDAADSTDYGNTVIIDYTGRSKGSSLGVITRVLNVSPDNIRLEPDPASTVDFRVIIGSSYTSCTYNVLPPEATPTPTVTPAS